MFIRTEKCLVECFGESLILHLKAFSNNTDMVVVKVPKKNHNLWLLFNGLKHCYFNAFVTYDIVTNELVDWCIVPSTGFELSDYYEEYRNEEDENGLKKEPTFISNDGYLYIFNPDSSCFICLDGDDNHNIYINDYEFKYSLTAFKRENDLED